MHVVFRTDASSQIGTGHVIRCLTLANAFRSNGVTCRFICRKHLGHLIDLIRSNGFDVHALPGRDINAQYRTYLAHENWLGGDWMTDAIETLRVLSENVVNWLIVDHYGLDYRWEDVVRRSCKKLLVIDDLADRKHSCDVLLDQNYGSSNSRYTGLVPGGCTQLHGPRFAMLNPKYIERRLSMKARDGKVKSVLIYFGGGADTTDLTGLALRAFCSAPLQMLQLKIVVGSNYAYKQSLLSAAAARGGTCVYEQLPDLSELIERTDLAIGAGGSTTWERFCLGLPSVVTSIADNQRPACEALARDNLIEYFDHSDELTAALISEHVLELINKPERLNELSEKSMQLVDGKGVDRILNEMELCL